MKIYAVPIGLEQKILTHIEKKMVVRGWILKIISCATFCATVTTGIYMVSVFKETGMYEYVSMIFSVDFSLWKELSLSILESLPIMGLIVFFALCASCVWSLGQIRFTHKLS